MNRGKFGLPEGVREDVIRRFLHRKPAGAAAPGTGIEARLGSASSVPDAFCRFDRFPGYERLLVPQAAAARHGVANPFFKLHEGVAGALTQIGGRSFINFSSYNYLGLSGHPRVNKAARDAIERYGTSVGASRLVAGERPIQQELEQALAAHYGVESCIAFVSGHATNVSTIGYLFGPKDLVLHDALIHNSVLEGIKLSGATRRSFRHNDCDALEAVLAEIRPQYERVLIVVEGLYSMDGDVPDLRRLVDIKTRHKAFLMVDEAHSLGVLGDRGRGIHEHAGVPSTAVDIWMGTLSKTLAGCGGYIAGERALVEHLKYAAPGFVYSVGLSPPLAAASLEALRIMQAEPERVARLRLRSRYAFDLAARHGLDTGYSQGHAVIPIIIKSSLRAARLSNDLYEHGINIQPVVYPAVEERAARLRLFVSSQHTEAQIETTMQTLATLVRR